VATTTLDGAEKKEKALHIEETTSSIGCHLRRTKNLTLKRDAQNGRSGKEREQRGEEEVGKIYDYGSQGGKNCSGMEGGSLERHTPHCVGRSSRMVCFNKKQKRLGATPAVLSSGVKLRVRGTPSSGVYGVG